MRAVVTTWGSTPAIASSTASRFRLAGPGLLAVTLLLAAGTVGAATFTVTKTADTADGVCDTDCSLREAIIAANANPGADDITLPVGSYTLTLTGTPEEGALTGDLDITDDLTINGAGQASTVIDGGGGPLDDAGAATDRVFEIQQGTVAINDVTVRGGHPPVGSGGGIRNAGDLTLTDAIIEDNVGRYGGGIMNGLYSISDSNAPDGPTYSFTDISGSGTPLNLGPSGSSLEPIGFDFSFYGRTHTQVFVSSEGYLTFTDNRTTNRFNDPIPDEDDPHDAVFPFWDNLDQGAGNVYVQTLGSAPSRRFVVQYDGIRVCDDSFSCVAFTDAATFQVILEEGTNNILFQYVDLATDARTQGGGATVGISGPETQLDGVQYSVDQPVLSDTLAIRFAPATGDLVLSSVTVQNNDSTFGATGNSDDVEGAGLYNTGTASIDASSFTDNLGEDPADLDTSGNGGGLANRGGTITVTASTISNNTAGQNGGGVSNRSGTMTLDDTVVSGNTVYCGDEPNGGGAANRRGELAIVNGSQIINNTLDGDGCDASGAGIMTLFGTVRVEDSEVSGNVFTQDESNGAGGGIMARMSTVLVDNSLVTDNVTDQGRPPGCCTGVTGGGIDAVKSVVEVRNASDVSRNVNNTISPTEVTDSLGGGFRVISSNLTVADSTVSNNDAGAASGGGIANVGYADYSVIDSKSSLGPTFSFEDISTTGTPLALADGSDQQVAIGFPFRSFEVTTGDVWISDDGRLYFGGSATDPSVFGFNDDLDPTTGTLYYDTRGTAPNRRFIVQYQDMGFVGDLDAGAVTFQMILYEGSNDVLMQYADVEDSDRARGSDAEVGVRGGAGSLPRSGEKFEYSRFNPALSNGLAVLFPATGNLSVSNTSVAGNSAGDTGGGIFNDGMVGIVSASLSDVDLSGNNATGGDADLADVSGGVTGSTVLNGSADEENFPGTELDDDMQAVPGNRVVDAAAGNDIIRPSGAAQMLTGGPGTDTFVYDTLTLNGTTITDFDPGAPELLDLSAIIAGFGSPADPLGEGYVVLFPFSGSTVLLVDPDGSAGPAPATPFLTLLNVPSGSVVADNFVF
ncbi:hypothetical protein CKO31_21305 [Thiohalocapsa halophila]|uniref:CSLREA domain-containing protein n=1 Tax=Thiohalocapsa halophila TaxID=69359 RepID=A0ABS1CMS0_9GAMM|nr:CSLREA domain-containing protein [Thiohalocapsa halophila]MBK1633243.1 hypothetical protein [Thiohalocapsa halophila]